MFNVGNKGNGGYPYRTVTIIFIIMKFASLFSGIGGADRGALDAGLTPIWGVEYNKKSVDIYRRNFGDHIIHSDLLNVDPSAVEYVDVLHASPPCPNFSSAKTKRGETINDVELAKKVAKFIHTLKPKIFTLENVYLYRKSKSWNIILNALNTSGYWTDYSHVNFADFGVPQSRKRMFVRSIRGQFVPYLPPSETWIGWYYSISDLIEELEHYNLLPSIKNNIGSRDMNKTWLINNKDVGFNNVNLFRERNKPSFTITKSHRLSSLIIVHDGNVKKSSIEVLKRLQTFPDNFAATVAGVGNAVPPLAYQKIIYQLVKQTI